MKGNKMSAILATLLTLSGTLFGGAVLVRHVSAHTPGIHSNQQPRRARGLAPKCFSYTLYVAHTFPIGSSMIRT